ncbi:hypothetical protein [Desulfonatronum parangueonense]
MTYPYHVLSNLCHTGEVRYPVRFLSDELSSYPADSFSEKAIILVFYSLAPASLAFELTPTVIKRGLARYEIPVDRLARLALARSMQSRGLGGQLILAAGRRYLLAASQVGGIALLIDAKDERATQWYSRYGATPLQNQPLSQFSPLKTIHAALTVAGKI